MNTVPQQFPTGIPAAQSLAGKTILVTGAGSGIGEAIARVCGAAGAFVCTTDIDPDKAGRTLRLIQSQGGAGRSFKLDVTRESDANAVAEAIERERGAVDVLVNNAGIGCVGALHSTPGDAFDRMYQVNVRGVVNVCRACLGPMLQRRNGAIIMIASVGGIVGIRDRIAYCASKFAVVGLTKCMALDYGDKGIRANCICPGRVETPFVAMRIRESSNPDEAYRAMASTQLSNRMIQPEQIAHAVSFLASDAASMINGAAWMIDDGWTAGK